MYCSNCGKEVMQDSEFCNHCGNKITLKKNDNKSVDIEEKHIESSKDYVWTCDYCGKEFDEKVKSNNHEKECEKNPKNSNENDGLLCPKCGLKNKDDVTFCKKCGYKINSTMTNVVNRIDENSEDYKKIKNAGSTAEGLGWFNLFAGPILSLIQYPETNDYSLVIISIIYSVVIATILIKYGKKVKKVEGVRQKDINILLVTTIFIVSMNIVNSISEGGSGGFMGILFIIELFYLFKAKSILKKIN